jgi:uncharacterized membrane protein YhaH (DUF805 family)
MHWYLEVWKKFAVFTGRAQRKEYWMFLLINLLITFGLAFIDGATGLGDVQSGYGLLSGLYTLAVLIPGLAVSVRRLHDTGRSGWWVLVALIPVIGALILLIMMVRDSDPGQNQYGPNPKEAAA